MKWVSGYKRDSGGRLLVRVQSAVGHELLLSLPELSADMGLEDARTLRRMPLDLSKGVAMDPGEYLSLLGLAGLAVDGQPVYEFATDARRLLIPAQLLVLATVGSQKQLRSELLSPEGPEALMTVVIGPEGLLMTPTPFRRRPFDLQPQWNAPRLEWIQCYPSVRRAWASVYANALMGRMDISPIDATCAVNVRGFRAKNGTFLVTSLKITEATPNEQPFEFARGLAAPSFLFDSKTLVARPKGGAARAPRKEAGLEGVLWAGAVSDDQWAMVEPLLSVFLKLDRTGFGRPKRKYKVRELVDVMLDKTIRGVPWPQAHEDEKRVRTAIELFYRLTKAGVWGEIVARLSEQS